MTVVAPLNCGPSVAKHLLQDSTVTSRELSESREMHELNQVMDLEIKKIDRQR